MPGAGAGFVNAATPPLQPDASLGGAISAAGSAFSLTGAAPAAMFGSRLAALAVDYEGGTNCEVRLVQSLAGSTFTVNTPFKLAHAKGASVLWLRDKVLTPLLFGALANSGDAWSAFQRAGLNLQTGCRIDGLSWWSDFIMTLTQPVILTQAQRMDNFSFQKSVGGWVAGTGPNAFLLPVARNVLPFTATAADDKIHFAAGLTGLGTRIMFNDPYGEGFPTGFLQGTYYYVQNFNSGAGTCTLSTDAAGLSPVNITADGAGYMFYNTDSTNKIFLQHGKLYCGADVGGIRGCAEQPSYLRDIQVDQQIAASVADGAVGIESSTGTQWWNWLNISLTGTTNTLGLRAQGTGIHCPDKITCSFVNGAPGAAAIINGCKDTHFGGFLIESADTPAGIRLQGTLLDVSLGYLVHEEATAGATIDDQSTNGGWSCEGGWTTVDDQHIISIPEYGIDLYSNRTGLGGMTTDDKTWGKIERNRGTLIFHNRIIANPSANYNVQPHIDTYFNHANNLVATLPSVLGWEGVEWTFLDEPSKSGGLVKPQNGQELILADGTTVVGPSTTAIGRAGMKVKGGGPSGNQRWYVAP